ncbi:hypothetical protein JX265_010140 [Neoarthrinium moseri]|uniref:Uncharacterized protein n=1 Tax=Neoarthrinium moseri TaxID=1658444 RepID=A0A9P9WF68_9PEZI|nr:hypothetical protein JX265_010140 [Neoarthrinium moseri]
MRVFHIAVKHKVSESTAEFWTNLDDRRLPLPGLWLNKIHRAAWTIDEFYRNIVLSHNIPGWVVGIITAVLLSLIFSFLTPNSTLPQYQADAGIADIVDANQVGVRVHDLLIRQHSNTRSMRGVIESVKLPRTKALLSQLDVVVDRTFATADKVDRLGDKVLHMGFMLKWEYENILEHLRGEPFSLFATASNVFRTIFGPADVELSFAERPTEVLPTEEELYQAWCIALQLAASQLEELIADASELVQWLNELLEGTNHLHNLMYVDRGRLEAKRESHLESFFYRWIIGSVPNLDLNNDIAMVEAFLPDLTNSKAYVERMRDSMKDAMSNLVGFKSNGIARQRPEKMRLRGSFYRHRAVLEDEFEKLKRALDAHLDPRQAPLLPPASPTTTAYVEIPPRDRPVTFS